MNTSNASSLSPASRILDAPHLGISLILSWHYCLWFTPNPTAGAGILSPYITAAWLAALACTGIGMIAQATAVKRCAMREGVLMHIAAGAMTTGTMMLCMTGRGGAPSPWVGAGIGAVLGAACGGALLAWGIRSTALRVPFSAKAIAPTFAATVFVSLFVSYVLPPAAAAAFCSALPLASLAVFRRGEKHEKGIQPTLLPQPARRAMARCAATLLLTGAATELALSFVSGSTPHELRGIGTNGALLPWSIAIGLVSIGSLVLVAASRKKGGGPYALIPLAVVFAICALSLSLAGTAPCSLAAFVICIGMGVVLDILLIAFFGTLASKGYISAPVAFAAAIGIPRISAAAGDGIGIIFRCDAAISDTTANVCLIGICVLAALLMAATRQEDAIMALTGPGPREEQTERICEAAAEEFALSPRETEILFLIARGGSVESIARKLVVSPYTVQTHIQHIYRKMNIHKRNDLLDYLNLRRESSE